MLARRHLCQRRNLAVPQPLLPLGIAYLPLDPSAKATLVMAGIDLPIRQVPVGRVHLMPNLKWVTTTTRRRVPSPEDDLFALLTLMIELP